MRLDRSRLHMLRASLGRGRLASLLAALLLSAGAAAATTDLADQPLFASVTVPGNLALTVSVEYPTAISVANIDTSYVAATTYIGLFDPAKCYDYKVGDSTTGGGYFSPGGAATSAHVCSSKWSGNFLNWATTQTIDTFRSVLTGGYRSIDTATLTILEKAWGSADGSAAANFPNRTMSGATLINGATPTSSNFTTMALRIWNGGNLLYFTGKTSGGTTAVAGATPPTPVLSTSATAYDGRIMGSGDVSTVWALSVRVKVCESASNLEANCTAYGSNYKPEGLLQQYATRIRFAIFGYLNDSNIKRDGGVLRAKMKFVGPVQPVPGSPSISNPYAEWDASTGVFKLNPNPADATATGNGATDSGVINYLNKFGQASKSYKSYDPVSELYYATLRYFKNQGNVPEYTALNGTASQNATYVDGFPVITSWDDPITYSCQQNFILGIGDTNTHADANLPGTIPTSTNEPAKPALVVADTTVNAKTATDKVGKLEAASSDPSLPSWLSSLGSTSPSTYWCCNNNTFGMAGLAYDAHTKDIRPNDFKNPDGSKSTIQTVATYWLDVLEGQVFRPYNQYWLAAKYGGFVVPNGYAPYTNTTPLANSTWRTNTDTVGGSYPRPDNYFTANNPTAMTNGLRSAFADIASKVTEVTTAFVTSIPQVQVSGNISYAASYNAGYWTGSLSANTASFDQLGNVTLVKQWDARDLLDTQAAVVGSVKGWDTGRLIATSSGTAPSAGTGVAFRLANLSSALQNTLGSTSTAQQNLLNFLRGDRSNEGVSYRIRKNLLGDIVNSKAQPVAPPNAPYSDSTNPGYSAYKTAKASRPTVVYAGANDGFLHAFDGSIGTSTSGKELFAYMPSMVFGGPNGTPSIDGAASLANTAFVHHYLVDATPAVYDVDFNRAGTPTASTTDWRSLLIGGLGKGGRGYYALDVSAPDQITTEAQLASKVLWEFTDSRMGYTFGPPLVIKTKKYGWVAALTSGYNNSDGKGYLFLVNPKTGGLLETLSTNTGSSTTPSGLSEASAYVVDYTDFTAESIYAGDLLGNLWRFDLTAASGSYPAPTLLATLANASGTAQPITARPLVEVDPGTLVRYVTVGTGRLLATTDTNSASLQGYYAIKDGTRSAFAPVTAPITRADLVDNTASLLTGIASDSGKGWFVNLGVNANGVAQRVITDSTANYGTVAFTAAQPNGDACNPSGTSQIYALSLSRGKSLLVRTTTTDTGSTTTPVTSITTAGFTTDLSFVNVAGRVRLEAGNDQGVVTNITGNFDGITLLKRLNWREIPISN